ncbi:MAG: ribosome-binding factor A, partial [Marinirhabdus sp.]
QLGIIITVSKVHVTVDLSLAKVYISVFPANRAAAVLGEIVKTGPRLKHEVAKRTKNQLRKMPDLSFYHDDTTAYIEGIENAMRGSENPITDPALLPKRKKS